MTSPSTIPSPSPEGIEMVVLSLSSESQACGTRQVSTALPTCRSLAGTIDRPSFVFPFPSVAAGDVMQRWRRSRFVVRFRCPPSPLHLILVHLEIFKHLLDNIDFMILSGKGVYIAAETSFVFGAHFEALPSISKFKDACQLHQGSFCCYLPHRIQEIIARLFHSLLLIQFVDLRRRSPEYQWKVGQIPNPQLGKNYHIIPRNTGREFAL
mmetsp:Transcript_13437/g.38390  ORF Transcript_13437/g.38390 Transcript_13437/m.38390 type:complete len:210 (-) Transcript_13437:200-829(-)